MWEHYGSQEKAGGEGSGERGDDTNITKILTKTKRKEQGVYEVL